MRINQLSLALLHLFGQAVPEVFREAITRPLGIADGWSWQAYDEAWVDVRGQGLPSVPGGTHWGGGVAISTRAQARIGQLLLDEGRHDGVPLLPAGWAARMRQPGALAPFYGWLMWLNPGAAVLPGASSAASFMVGAGGHYTWVEPAHDAVVVVRWLDGAASAGFMQRAAQALAAAA